MVEIGNHAKRKALLHHIYRQGQWRQAKWSKQFSPSARRHVQLGRRWDTCLHRPRLAMAFIAHLAGLPFLKHFGPRGKVHTSKLPSRGSPLPGRNRKDIFKGSFVLLWTNTFSIWVNIFEYMTHVPRYLHHTTAQKNMPSDIHASFRFGLANFCIPPRADGRTVASRRTPIP